MNRRRRTGARQEQRRERRSQERVRQRVQGHAQRGDAYAFFNLLTGPQFFKQVESLLPEHRERLFPPTETLSMFLAQLLSPDRSCQGALDQRAVKRLNAGLTAGSTHTGGYCQARKRLPLEMVSHLAKYVGQKISQRLPAAWCWRGRPVRLVDGTTLTMPDTAANQSQYPQSRTQKPGLGFPIVRWVGIVCLGSGALLNAALGRYQGKGGDEQTLLRRILDTLNRGDVLVGDAFFGTYFLLSTLAERGIDAVFEQHGSRARVTDFRRGKRLGERDHLIVLDKPVIKPDWMNQADYEGAPATLTVRELRTGGKTLLTTFLDAKQTSKADLRALYKNRWHVELDLRNIKSTLGMERLSCKTPEMVLKEVWVYGLAYNLIRLMMAQAAKAHGCSPRALSFKHSVQLWLAWHHHGHDIQDDTLHVLFVLIGQQRVGDRPGRIEPRAVKRRPKPYPLLTQPRALAREHIRMHGHPKKA